MSRKMALSAVGSDCPGIVAEVSRVLFLHGCNIEDSSMTILRGEFAMILIVALPDQTPEQALSEELQKVAEKLRLILSFRELPAHTEQAESEPGVPYIVSVYGADRPGIVHQVTRGLAERKVNITDVNTRMVGQGSPVYIMILEVDVPESAVTDGFEAGLKELAKELSVDITVRPLETAHL